MNYGEPDLRRYARKVWGSQDKAWTYQRFKRRVIRYPYVGLKGEETLLRKLTRIRFRRAVRRWKRLRPWQKRFFNKLAKKKRLKMSGINLFIKLYLTRYYGRKSQLIARKEV